MIRKFYKLGTCGSKQQFVVYFNARNQTVAVMGTVVKIFNVRNREEAISCCKRNLVSFKEG